MSVLINKNIQTAALGNTPIWTPTSGMRFRVARIMILITNNATAVGGGLVNISIRDANISIGMNFIVSIPAAAPTPAPGCWSSGWFDFGAGILSAALNNVLNINLDRALSNGMISVLAIGTEE